MISTAMGLPCTTSRSIIISSRSSLPPRRRRHDRSEWWNHRGRQGGGGGGGGGVGQSLSQSPSQWVEEVIMVREARLEDTWEVAETHCSSFFPHHSFPLDFALRIDRLLGLLSPFSLPIGCRRTCLVASTHHQHVAGILTLDTLADFLPRKGPLRRRRTGIAYVSNVAVRERDRCKGIAKKLMVTAEAQAKSWGCRAIALHCDVNNPAATQLYRGQGFKCIKVPERAQWPQPKTSPNVQFSFMMKLLTTHTM